MIQNIDTLVRAIEILIGKLLFNYIIISDKR